MAHTSVYPPIGQNLNLDCYAFRAYCSQYKGNGQWSDPRIFDQFKEWLSVVEYSRGHNVALVEQKMLYAKCSYHHSVTVGDWIVIPIMGRSAPSFHLLTNTEFVNHFKEDYWFLPEVKKIEA